MESQRKRRNEHVRGSVSDISGKEDHRGKAEAVRIFEEEERGHILRRVSDATILGKTERKTDNQVERRV